MKNNKVTVEEVLEKMVDIKTHLEKLLKLMDKARRKTLAFRKLKSSIEDFEPFRNDERIQLVSREILELSNAMELKVADFN
jgi:hypothetical protein